MMNEKVEQDFSGMDQNSHTQEIGEFTPEQEAYFEKMMGLDDPKTAQEYSDYLASQPEPTFEDVHGDLFGFIP